jgi:hypothetical protein
MTHKSLYSALAAAQAEMGPALKDAVNPAFKSKYADLASVVAAVMPALNKHGIAVLQPPYDDEAGRYVKTILVHGETGETAECRVPLIIQKNDMQGYGSAVTYARRYGLMGMAGIAPEDDDGNAAAKAAPPKNERPAKSMQPAEAPAQQNGVKHASSAEMKRWLVKLNEDLADVHTLVTLESLRASVERGMAANNWPNLDPDGDYYETGFPKMARDKLAAREEQIIAAIDAAEIKDLREPNVLMAGE